MFSLSNNWLKESSLEETLSFLKSAALRHCQRSGPYADRLTKYISEGDWNRVVDFDLDYDSGLPEHLYHARQALGFFTKLKCLPLGINTEEVAWRKFRENELDCRATNNRLRLYRAGLVQPSPAAASIIAMAQWKIAEVLGDVPSYDKLCFEFGPGANTSVKASASSPRWKLEAPLECSHDLAPILPALLSAVPHWAWEHRIRREPGSILESLEEHMQKCMVPVVINSGKLTFVDKNAKTKRSIVVEPLLNSIGQKAFGSYIKQRLRRIGIDIGTQAERNKALARSASLDGSLATIDLSSASDTISYEVVAELLPLDWFCALKNFRTSRVKYKDTEISLEKFSSMGNAFTFELETLIFWALAWASARFTKEDASNTYAFGDDILLPTASVAALFEALSFLGFTVNKSKSFWTGRFRESCGGDYVLGFDIRPYYQKDLVTGESAFTLHNFYMRTFQFDLAAEILEYIPESLRIWGPDGYGDGHLIGDWRRTASLPRRLAERGFGGAVFETFTHSKRRCKARLKIGDSLLPLYSIYVGGSVDYWTGDTRPTDHFVLRGSVGYKRVQIYTHSTGVFI